MVKEKTRSAGKEKHRSTEKKDLVVHNDDFNTFEFVIQTLIEVCNHEPEQAEQCTLIIHYKGKCVVRTGDYQTLEPMYREILKRGLTATIE
ncbi:MAG: ATP-dependent Clp protease adaptor ClpS [Bacteroidales bacterium]|jgi:ATP-dependent Clp protease adaptor protein ClpS|nr:ATP-dependent Clp protease adaptor ClpS [Bacteroidales bacterium]NLM93825.1 ATP-dependent Clp protease adaptor ClpS [Bacteroidales bacterium]